MKFLPFFRTSVLLCLLGLTPGTAWSQAEKPEAVAADWNSRLQSTRTHLITGEHQKALDLATPLLHEMMNSIQSGPGVARSLALTVLSRALAEAGLGDMDAAYWDWHTARALDPSIGEMDLTPFGAAGAALKAVGPIQRNTEVEEAMKDEKSSGKSKRASKDRVQPPKVLTSHAPRYPKALREICAKGVVLVESIIDEEGRLRAPGLKNPQENPILAIAALEALRTWRFEPARFKGEPVNVYYTLTVNFIPQDCVRKG
jgi:TonB family protein